MDIQAYLGLGVVVLGLVMSVGGVMRRDYADALSSVAFSLLGALFLTAGLMEPGWTTYAVLAGIIAVGIAVRLAASRLSRRQGG